MSKKFKGKKHKSYFLIKFLSFIVIVLLVVYISFNYLYDKVTKNISEVEVINILLNNKTDEFEKIFSENGLNFIVNYTLGLNLEDNKPKKIVNEKVDVPTIKEEPENNNEPLIYIYNTHQTEEYKSVNTNSYNITPTVMHASFILQNKLKELGINSIVEKNSIKEILDINSWNYRNSYKASKMLASDALEKNPSIKYVIDLHRDSVPENVGRTTINDKNYARMMIVLGTSHEGYPNNLNMANRINDYLKAFNENITRGLDIKNNSGIFNQDLSPNAILIEVGGQYNDISSVSNSLEVLAQAYKKVIDEDNEKKET